MAEAIVFDYSIHRHLLSSFVDIHMDVIENEDREMTFIPPLQRVDILQWWEDYAKQPAERRTLIMVLEKNLAEVEELAGFVMLGKPWSQTGPFRGYIEKLIVSSRYRQQGIAKRLMKKLEEVARSDGRILLMLDTEEGSTAEFVYPRMGYIEMGRIPNYAISPSAPEKGRLTTGVFFYKDLENKSSLSKTGI